jgi:hypothetical protein
MRFLRLLTNSLLAGVLGAAYLTILVLQLNPQVPLFSRTTLHWFATLGAFYGTQLAILFYVTMLLRELVSGSVFSPGWISVRMLAWLAATAAAVAATLMWLNLRGFPTVFDEAAARLFAFGAGATTVSAMVLLGIAVAHYSSGRRGSRVGAALVSIAIVGSLTLPVAARGRGGTLSRASRRVGLSASLPTPERTRITLLMLDGASLEYVWPRVVAGRLPNFGRVLDSGASMDLATIRPTQPDPVWAAVATGMYPAKSGVRSAASYFAPGDDRAVDLLPDHCFSHVLVRLGVLRERANSSAAWNASPLWTILGGYGIRAGIVRWPLTYPAQEMTGFLLTDKFHETFEFDQRAGYPPEILPIARDAFAGSSTARQWDEFYSRATRDLRAQHEVQVEALRYQCLDTAGHLYLRTAEPRPFGDVSERQRQQYGGALDSAYAFVDGEIGSAIDRLAPGDLLLVVSGFGMQPISPTKHLTGLLLRDPDVSGTHENAPDGFLLAFGAPVEPGRKQRGSIVDVTPTILYALGLPVGRDMDGYARADIFTRAFTAERPIAFIPSYNP